jgi:hypothetical protein
MSDKQPRTPEEWAEWGRWDAQSDECPCCGLTCCPEGTCCYGLGCAPITTIPSTGVEEHG